MVCACILFVCLSFPAGELTLEELKGAPEEVREQLKEVAGTEDDGMEMIHGIGELGFASVGRCWKYGKSLVPTVHITILVL